MLAIRIFKAKTSAASVSRKDPIWLGPAWAWLQGRRPATLHWHEGRKQNRGRSPANVGVLAVAVYFLASAHLAAQAPASPGVAPPPQYDPREQCFQLTDHFSEVNNQKGPAGQALIIDTPFLDTGSPIEVGLAKDYKDGEFFFVALVDSSDTENPDGRQILNTNAIVYRRAQSGDTLVKKNLLKEGQTILGMTIPDGVASYWSRAELFAYNCDGSPKNVSHLPARVSSLRMSTAATWISIIVAYLIAAFAFRSGSYAKSDILSALNPLKMTAGVDGKASLAKLQILFFSLIVFGLIVFFLLRTGVLTDISDTVLLLMGISGVGSTLAKGADAQRTTISADNRGWLLRKGWLSLSPRPSVNVAKWFDLFTTDGEFDVYRYQSFIFSVAVGIALIAGGVTQLSSFSIPSTLLGILGLSQAVYIGGKLVTPTTMADLNQGIADLSDLEKKLRTSLMAARPGFVGTVAEAKLIVPNEYQRYLEKAKDVSAVFRSLTGNDVKSEQLEPSLG